MAAPLKTTKEWAALDAHHKEVEVKELHMRRLFEEDPRRFEQFRWVDQMAVRRVSSLQKPMQSPHMKLKLLLQCTFVALQD